MMKYLQKLGKALMLPVAVLPICGLSRTRVELVFRVLFRQSYKSLFICNAFGSSPAF